MYNVHIYVQYTYICTMYICDHRHEQNAAINIVIHVDMNILIYSSSSLPFPSECFCSISSIPSILLKMDIYHLCVLCN